MAGTRLHAERTVMGSPLPSGRATARVGPSPAGFPRAGCRFTIAIETRSISHLTPLPHLARQTSPPKSKAPTQRNAT